jgi:precorrin-3B synthase
VPEPSPFASRAAADRCPGVLRLAEAADGLLARVRLPGGLVSREQLLVLAGLAGELGDGRVELTSRGNVQLRGLRADAAGSLTNELTEAGLCASERLAELPGRFLFAIDDGRGDVAGLGADVVATVRADGAAVSGLAVSVDDVPDVMLASAEAFLVLRAGDGGTAWRVADLPGGADRVRAAVAARFGLAAARDEAGTPGSAGVATTARPVGLVARHETDGGMESAASVRDDPGASAVLIAPLGRLTAAQLTWVAERAGKREARITPWRSVVLPHLADAPRVLREAARLGFGTDEGSPWLRVTACAGRPGCASALADVQADAAGFAGRWPGRVVHVSGCERHCGRPAATEIDVTATSEGYQVAGV